MLAACSSTPWTPVEPNNSFAYVWVATPRPAGDEAARASHFQMLVAIELAQRGYRQDPRGALAIALTFSRTDDPSLGPHQGGYAVFTPTTQCSARQGRLEQPMTGCISIIHRLTGEAVSSSSPPLRWNADQDSMERALNAMLGAADHSP
jgi:hypothetical protein